jgi:predicted NBD/HSP70 family sugar kinase
MTLQNTPLRGEDIREKNEKIILRAIQHSEGLSQSDVVNLTGLKAPTVLRIFSILEEKGLIEVASDFVIRDSDKKGRKPVYYRVVLDSQYAIGIEFWSRTAHVLVVDFSRKPVYSEDIILPESIDADTVSHLLEELVASAIEKTGFDAARLLGIGIGAPGQINMDTGMVIRYARIPGFTNYPLALRFERRFDTQVLVTNNAGVIAMNAYRRGAAKDSHALFTYFIRQGVGGAFITKGKLFSVLGKTTFEIGHTTSVMDGKPCYCGSQGCLETYISETAIVEATAGHGYQFTEIEEVASALAQGDHRLRDIIKEEAVQLAVSAQNMFRILSPDGFLIITRFRELSDIYAEVVRDCLEQDPYNAEDEQIQVYSDAYSPLEAGFGACDLVFDWFFSIHEA